MVNVMYFLVQKALTSTTIHSNSEMVYVFLILGLSVQIIVYKMTFYSMPFRLGTSNCILPRRHENKLKKNV